MTTRLRKRLRDAAGSTMIEMMVAGFISTVFILAAGTAYLVNQNNYRRNTEKLRLQQTATHAIEIMEKKIRMGTSVVIPVSADRIQVFDLNGNEITRFRLSNLGPNVKLFEQNSVLATQELIQLNFVQPNVKTATVLITLTLEDEFKNKVTLKASAALRNHPNLRNVK
jgi:Tfp pilus assembly protein PilE